MNTTELIAYSFIILLLFILFFVIPSITFVRTQRYYGALKYISYLFLNAFYYILFYIGYMFLVISAAFFFMAIYINISNYIYGNSLGGDDTIGIIFALTFLLGIIIITPVCSFKSHNIVNQIIQKKYNKNNSL